MSTLHLLACWGFAAALVFVVRRAIPLPDQSLPQGWTPERVKRHKERSDALARELVANLNRNVMAEKPAPRALDIDLRNFG